MEASVGGDDLEKRGASGRNKEGRRGRRAERERSWRRTNLKVMRQFIT